MDPNAFFKSTVVDKWRYVTPRALQQRIRKMRHTCASGDAYLECVLEYRAVSKLASEFAEIHRAPELACPDAFLEYCELNSPDADTDTVEST